jgi:hypothetical protein
MADLNTWLAGTVEDAWLARLRRLKFVLSADAKGDPQTVARTTSRRNPSTYQPPVVVAQATGSAEEFSPRGPLYIVPVSLVCETHAARDPDCADLTYMQGIVGRLALTTTAAQLTAAMAGATCPGVEYEGETALFEDHIQRLSIDLRVHVFATVAAPTTTTTTTTT